MKNLRFNLLLAIAAVLVIASFGIELHYLKLKSVPFITKLILLSLFN